MARRLSKKDSPKKPSHQMNYFPNLIMNCSSSTCSTMSPHSPSGRTLFRTPSYKMPKTPSLSRQHPSTYVTQHTSSRSRPSSRASSRAASPTREHIEALLQNQVMSVKLCLYQKPAEPGPGQIFISILYLRQALLQDREYFMN